MLVADIGTSRASFGLFENKNLKAIFHINSEHFLDQEKVEQEISESLRDKLYYNLSQDYVPDRLVIASVNQKVNDNLNIVLKNYFKIDPQFLSWQSNMNIDLMVENPQTLGIDRIANAVAAQAEYHGPVIIVDIGTAITVDYLNQRGEFMGGAITPGPITGVSALRIYCPHLPEIELGRPPNIIGQFTKEAVQSGIYYGWSAMIEGLISRFLKKEAESNSRILVTGGLGSLFAEEISHPTIVDPNLTLKGIKILGDLNK